MATFSKEVTGAGFVILKAHPIQGFNVLVMETTDGDWDLPKGTIDPGEEAYPAAFREIKEEVGITHIDLLWGDTACTTGPLVMMIGVTDEEPVLQENPHTGILEHKQAIWVSFEKAFSLMPVFLKPCIAWAKGVATGQCLPSSGGMENPFGYKNHLIWSQYEYKRKQGQSSFQTSCA